MKFKTDRDFKAEEMYELFETGYVEHYKKWTAELAECRFEDTDEIDSCSKLAEKLVYAKCLLDSVHTLDLNIGEMDQAIKVMSNKDSYSSLIDLFMDFGALPTVQSVSEYFRLVVRVLLWHESKNS